MFSQFLELEKFKKCLVVGIRNKAEISLASALIKYKKINSALSKTWILLVLLFPLLHRTSFIGAMLTCKMLKDFINDNYNTHISPSILL
jgi:hypothetical protein